MVIMQTQKPDESKAKPAVTECAYAAELAIVKEKLKCAKHAGQNRWCFVKADGEHEELGLAEITLWARKMVSSTWNALDTLLISFSVMMKLIETAILHLTASSLIDSMRVRPRELVDPPALP
jgi:hypothetical protein